MSILKHWIAFFLLALITASVQASSPLLHLILPDKREISLDETALAALPQAEFRTETPWTDGMHSYRGPTLAGLLAAQGVKDASQIEVLALNGYQQRVDLALFAEAPLTLARYQDGKALTRRNKGPLWLLVPFSDHPQLNVSAVHSNMVWQVTRIEVIH